jgi:DNA-binding transcriptional ArsR family regulator
MDRDTPTSNTHPELPDRETETVDPDELLSLLSDDHARSILEAVAEEGRPARIIAERLDLSRATVYRRLNRLEAAGLVDTRMAYHSEGHHRKHYRATLDEVRLSFDGGDVAVAATVS